jgi:arylsulfatase
VVYDGKNLVPVLTSGAKSPHKSFFFQFRTHAALRQGDWKIVREKPTEAWQLFNLKSDVGETENLAKKNPQRVRELQETFADWEKSFAPSN